MVISGCYSLGNNEQTIAIFVSKILIEMIESHEKRKLADVKGIIVIYVLCINATNDVCATKI